jgi:hypothetical protein
MRVTTFRAAIVATVTAAGLALVCVPSHADDRGPTVTVADQPGAPGEALQQLGGQTGEPLGGLERVVAVDLGGQHLTIDQLVTLVAGREVAGVQTLGVISGGQELRDTTLADLSDGSYDGPRDTGTPTATLLFASPIPESRDWCLTMCIAGGRTAYQCIFLARLKDAWRWPL